MENLRKALEVRLKGARRIAILGIGSDLRGDDAAGMLVAESIERGLKKRKAAPDVRIFLGATAPENLTGEIRRFKPTHLFIIDSVEMKEPPGTILLLSPDEVGEGASFSTHNMPAKILIVYFQKYSKMKATIIGIQPRTLEFDKAPSKDVRSAAREVAFALKAAIKGISA